MVSVLCNTCRSWLINNVQDIVCEQDQNSDGVQLRHTYGDQRPFSRYTPRSQDVWARRFSCWLCSQISFLWTRTRQSQHDQSARQSSGEQQTRLGSDLVVVTATYNGTHILVTVGDDIVEYNLRMDVFQQFSFDDDACEADPTRYEIEEPLDFAARPGQSGSAACLKREPISFSEYGRSLHRGLLDGRLMRKARVDKILDWLHRCDVSHGDCKVLSTGESDLHFLPTRLLAVHHDEDLRVVEASTLHEAHDVRYATLSHRWSDATLLEMLRPTNYAEYTRYISPKRLSRVSQEAVEMCRLLAIPYLWIDSLCIIQNETDQKDWSKEAPRMHKVYGNSYLNMAATGYGSPGDGLLREANPMLAAGVKLGCKGDIYIGCENQDIVHHIRDTSFSSAQILKRGWITQEVLLSPRVLHFADGQLEWSCRSLDDSEFAFVTSDDNPGRNKSEDEEEIEHTNQDWSVKLAPLHRDVLSSLEDLEKTWSDRVIPAFIETRVTFNLDRYNAISGIAALFQDAFTYHGVKTRFLAGCWSHNLVMWLTWNNEVTEIYQSYGDVCMPSWSWLACDNAIDFKIYDGSREHKEKEIVATVNHITYDLKNADLPFGPVARSVLTLQAPVFDIQVELSHTWKFDPTTIVSADEQLSAVLQGRASIPSLEGSYSVSGTCRFNHVPTDCCKSLKGVMLTLDDFAGVLAFMLVERSPNKVDGLEVYQRCGGAEIELDESFQEDSDEDSQGASILLEQARLKTAIIHLV